MDGRKAFNGLHFQNEHAFDVEIQPRLPYELTLVRDRNGLCLS